MMFRKACQLKKSSLSQFPFGKKSASYIFFTSFKQNDVISQSHKIVDNSKMKQGITKL